MSTAALAGITVIEMTEAMAGPYAAMMLGDLGADVIKIERPGVGDMSRGWGPPFLAGESAYYLSTNRNKRSLTLNLKHPEARGILDALIARADVFLVNQPRLASLQSLGIDYERLRGLNPRLIYCSITGYGMTGPYAGRSGYDLAAQGESGTMALTGEPDGPPVRYPVPISDITAGLYTVMAALAALYVRERTGQGQFIDTALLDSQITWLTNLAGNYFATGQRPRKLGNYHPQIAPYEPFQAQDKPFLVAVGSERLWEEFCRVLGVSETVGADPRFRTNADRLAHRFELRAELEPLFRSQPAEFWLSRLREAGIPCGAINEIDEALNDPHVQARGMIVTLEHPVIGPVRSIGNPMHLSLTPPSYRLPPPLLGQHTDEILQALGYPPDHIARLRQEGAI
ncbi:MAG: CoA transferase [Anaerolineae bacterium]|nr:CoA transferase [Caldilineales bacterium]MDW8269342.1 CoA transferase [Anaerolineae bacterium]